jgi:hypothetical protein
MSKLEVDAIEPQSGTTLTIGASGDSVNIASGATITDFTSTGIDDNATSTAITIDSSENVGIGTSSPNSQLDITNTTGASGLELHRNFSGNVSGPTNSGGLDFTLTDTATSNQVVAKINSQGIAGTGDAFGGIMRFLTSASSGTATERMRILSDGSVQIAKTTRDDVEMLGIKYSGNVANGIYVNSNTTNNSNAMLIANDANGVVGKIRSSGTSTSYITSSDYRLKENVSYDFDATTRLKQLKPARFNFIADADTTVDGFLAHEVQDIVPEAISGEKDETKTKEKVVVNANGQVIAENIEQADWESGKIADEDGNTQYPTDSTWEATKVVPVYQGIDQSKLVPLLVKTIQELEARITALENK